MAFSACVTYTSLNVNSLRSGMTVQEVRYHYGTPYRIITSTNTINGYLEILEYRNGRSIYALEFWDDYLVGYERVYSNYITPVAPPSYWPSYGTSVLVIRERHNSYYRPNRPPVNNRPPIINNPPPGHGIANPNRPGVDSNRPGIVDPNRPGIDSSRPGSTGNNNRPGVDSSRPGSTGNNNRPGVDSSRPGSVVTPNNSVNSNQNNRPAVNSSSQSGNKSNVVGTPQSTSRSNARRSNNVTTTQPNSGSRQGSSSQPNR